MWIYIGIGGAIGSLMRYTISLGLGTWIESNYPLDTLTVNVIGSIVLGFLTAYFSEKKFRKSNIYTGITTGLIGSFTTFSTFSMETFSLLNKGEIMLAFSYLAGSVILGLFGAALGLRLGNLFGRTADNPHGGKE